MITTCGSAFTMHVCGVGMETTPAVFPISMLRISDVLVTVCSNVAAQSASQSSFAYLGSLLHYDLSDHHDVEARA